MILWSKLQKNPRNFWANITTFQKTTKRKFLIHIEPIVCACGTQGFINQMNLLFNSGRK